MWFDLFDHFDLCRSILWFICGVLLIKYYIIHCRQMLFINNICTNLFFWSSQRVEIQYWCTSLLSLAFITTLGLFAKHVV